MVATLLLISIKYCAYLAANFCPTVSEVVPVAVLLPIITAAARRTDSSSTPDAAYRASGDAMKPNDLEVRFIQL